MSPFTLPLLALGYLASLATAAPEGALTDKPAQMKQWGTGQTYYVTADIANMGPPNNVVNYQNLLIYANAAFNYIKTQVGITTGSGSQIAIVACVGIEGQTRIFCGSAPRDASNLYFKDLIDAAQAANTATPRWEAAFRVPGHGDWAHAEDLAYWLFEKGTDLSQAPAGKYPAGTTVAVWSSASQGDRGTGKAYWPCEDGKTPSCQDVSNTLGVVHASPGNPFVNLVNPQGAAPANPFTKRSLRNSRAARSVSLYARSDPPADPGLDLTPVPLSDDLIAAFNDIATNKPDIASFGTSDSPQPEDQFDSQELDAAGATDTNTDTATDTGTVTQPPPTATPSCSLQNQDPDEGITDRYCICDSKTYPTMSLDPTAANSELCAYTALPDATTTYSSGFGPPTTYTSACQVCTQVVNNEDSCTPISGCVKQQAAASVTAATQGMHVGTLTGDALYTSVSSALQSICPDVTQTTSATECSGTAVIKDVTYVEDETIGHDGELKVSVAFSSYNVTSLKNAMINSLAAAARSSATGNNCYDANYEILEKRKWSPSRLFARDHPVLYHENINVCNTAELALVNYYSPYWRLAPDPGATDYIEAKYDFHISGGSFACEFLELLADGLAVIQPEFAVADVELGEAIDALCEALED